MTPTRIQQRVVADRLGWVSRMVSEIRSLPLDDREIFFADSRNLWTVESCLRRGLEALLDAGRHVLAKGFAEGVTDYKQVAIRLTDRGVLPPETGAVLRILAGYRNRMVHFYHEITPEELYRIAGRELEDVENVAEALALWCRQNPNRLDKRL